MRVLGVPSEWCGGLAVLSVCALRVRVRVLCVLGCDLCVRLCVSGESDERGGAFRSRFYCAVARDEVLATRARASGERGCLRKSQKSATLLLTPVSYYSVDCTRLYSLRTRTGTRYSHDLAAAPL